MRPMWLGELSYSPDSAWGIGRRAPVWPPDAVSQGRSLRLVWLGTAEAGKMLALAVPEEGFS